MDELYKAARFISGYMPAVKHSTQVNIPVNTVTRLSGSYSVRIAGLSGAAAVLLGAYGAHSFNKKIPREDLKLIFETGNRYHMIHSLALIGVPLTNRPHLTCALLVTGMLVFSGSCYTFALTENKPIRKITPVGGILLVLAWLSMIL